MGWLYCLLDDTHEFAGQIFEVRLVPQLEGEGFEGLPRVVLAAVEAAVYERLDAVPDGVEEGRDQERRCHHSQLGSLSRKGDPGSLQHGDAAEVQEPEHGGQGPVDQGAVDHDIYVVEAILEYRQSHRRRYREEPNQEQHVAHHGAVEGRPDAHYHDGQREQRYAVGYPFDLLALPPPRPAKSHYEGRDQSYRDGDQKH